MYYLTYNYEKPEAGDSASVFCPGLNRNLDKLVAHEHNGTYSKKINTYNLQKGSASSGAWVAEGTGYRQSVSLPAGYAFDTTNITCTMGTSNARFEPPIEKIDDSSFYVYCNDNTKTINFMFE